MEHNVAKKKCGFTKRTVQLCAPCLSASLSQPCLSEVWGTLTEKWQRSDQCLNESPPSPQHSDEDADVAYLISENGNFAPWGCLNSTRKERRNSASLNFAKLLPKAVLASFKFSVLRGDKLCLEAGGCVGVVTHGYHPKTKSCFPPVWHDTF